MSTKTIPTAFLACCCLALAACQNAPYEPSSVDSRQFPDVVVPDGFRLRDRAHESYAREEASWRQAHYVYVGSARIDEAVAHVRSQAPRHSWQMVAEEALDEEGKRLRFERGIYSSEYVFTRRDGQTQMVVDYATDYARR